MRWIGICHARCGWTSAMIAAVLLGRAAGAQVVRGTIRSSSTSLPIEAATVTVSDSAGSVVAGAVTDSAGRFRLSIPRRGTLELRVRRLGFAMGSTMVPAVAAGDTVEFEFLLEAVAAATEAVTVVGASSLNEKRLAEAYRRGWKVYDPEIVAQHRDQAQDFFQLLRAMGSPSLMIPRSINDCVRTTRNNQCLTFVVDGQVHGPTTLVLPSDIYFFAILTASESRVQFGDRAPWGAIAIYTRSRYDRTARPCCGLLP